MLVHLTPSSQEHMSCHSGGKVLGTNKADIVKDVANNNGCHFLDIRWCTKYYTKYTKCITSCNPHNNVYLVNSVITPFYRWENWG